MPLTIEVTVVTNTTDTFYRPHGLLAPFTSHSNSILYIPLQSVSLAFLVILPLTFNTRQDSVCQVSFRFHHMSKPSELPLLNDLHYFPMCSATLHCISTLVIMRRVMHLKRSSVAIVSNAGMRFSRSLLRDMRVHDL